MSTAFYCDRCTAFGGALGLPAVEPTHCYGEGDTPGTPGLIGSGNSCPCECRSWPHQPNELWNVAAKEHPGAGGEAERIARYRELMVEHGHLIPRTKPATQRECTICRRPDSSATSGPSPFLGGER